MTLQIVAFPQEDPSYPNGEALLEEALRLGPTWWVPFRTSNSPANTAWSRCIRRSRWRKYDRLVDVHCDEIDDEQSRFVETVAALALKLEMGAKVTASHTTAMHSYNGAYASRLFRLLKMSGINLSPTRW